MKPEAAVIILLVTILLCGCTPPSLQPLYNESDTAFDPALIGIWRDAEDDTAKNYFVSTRGANGAYNIVQVDGGGPASFTAHLVQLGDARFVDLYPAEPLVPTGFYGGHLVRVHSIGRVWLNGDRLRIGLLQEDWLYTREAQNAKPNGLHWTPMGETVLINDATPQLRTFAMRYADTKAFSVTTDWIREH